MTILCRSGKENSNADALSQNPCLPAPATGIAEDDVQVASLTSDSVSTSGASGSEGTTLSNDGLHYEQQQNRAFLAELPLSLQDDISHHHPATSRTDETPLASEGVATLTTYLNSGPSVFTSCSRGPVIIPFAPYSSKQHLN